MPDPRPVMFVGSVPLKPADAVFERIGSAIGDLTRQIPDGEQAGWAEAVFPQVGACAAVEFSRQAMMTSEGPFAFPIPFYRLKPGSKPEDIVLGPYGIADNAIKSYAAFVKAREAGQVPVGTRFQVTIPGPLTTGSLIELPVEILLPIVERPLLAEIMEIVAAIPAQDLTIQIDFAVEIEVEEYRRRPAAFDMPVAEGLAWSMADTTGAAARLAAMVPVDVNLGFHLCSIWHIFKGAGQDNRVHVDYANQLTQTVKRRIDYIHIPTIPEHDGDDFAPLADLNLAPETQLYLGVVHASDGIDGARRRIAAASEYVSNFGVAHFCGLSQWGAKEESIGPMIELHRAAACC